MNIIRNNFIEKKEMVILLMGETGCGKSTFINSLCNYLSHDSISEAEKDVKCVIMSKYHEFDSESGEQRTIQLGQYDKNEGGDSIKSSTQRCKCHVFEQGNFNPSSRSIY